MATNAERLAALEKAVETQREQIVQLQWCLGESAFKVNTLLAQIQMAVIQQAMADPAKQAAIQAEMVRRMQAGGNPLFQLS